MNVNFDFSNIRHYEATLTDSQKKVYNSCSPDTRRKVAILTKVYAVWESHKKNIDFLEAAADSLGILNGVLRQHYDQQKRERKRENNGAKAEAEGNGKTLQQLLLAAVKEEFKSIKHLKSIFFKTIPTSPVNQGDSSSFEEVMNIQADEKLASNQSYSDPIQTWIDDFRNILPLELKNIVIGYLMNDELIHLIRLTNSPQSLHLMEIAAASLDCLNEARRYVLPQEKDVSDHYLKSSLDVHLRKASITLAQSRVAYEEDQKNISIYRMALRASIFFREMHEIERISNKHSQIPSVDDLCFAIVCSDGSVRNDSDINRYMEDRRAEISGIRLCRNAVMGFDIRIAEVVLEQILKKRQHIPEQAFTIAARQGNIKMLEKLLEYGYLPPVSTITAENVSKCLEDNPESDFFQILAEKAIEISNTALYETLLSVESILDPDNDERHGGGDRKS